MDEVLIHALVWEQNKKAQSELYKKLQESDLPRPNDQNINTLV